MKKQYIILVLLTFFIITNALAQLVTFPSPGNDWRKSKIYSVKVKEGNQAYKQSYTFEYVKKPGNSDGDWCPVGVDPCSLGGKGLAVANDNHWTTVNYDNRGDELTFEISKLAGNINSCQVYPKRYGYSATISGGKAYVTVNANEKHIYLKINGDQKLPLFLFVDPLETETYTSDEPGVKYFGPGFHRIGREWKIPNGINTVYLAPGAVLFGSVSGSKDGQRIIGRGIISGEKDRFQKKAVGIPWNAVYFGNGLDDILIEGVTSISPIHFHFLTRGTSVTRYCKAFSFNYSTDGWGGGKNSVVEHCFFKVNDDVVKFYGDNQKALDLVVYHQTNGPVVQFSWGAQNAKNCVLKRMDVVESQTMFSPYKGSTSVPPALIEMRKVLNNNVQHTGHLFEDIQVDNGIAGLFVYLKKNDSNGYGVLDLTFKNINIAGNTWHAPHINGNYTNNGNSKVTIDHQNVKVNGICLKKSDYDVHNATANLTFDNCTEVCVTDSDLDGTNDCDDLCPNDPDKVEPGTCGCGNVDVLNCGTETPSDIDDLELAVVGCSVGLSWSDVNGETGYRIRRKEESEPTFTNIGDVPAGTASFLDDQVSSFTNYIYMVRPLVNGTAVALSNQPVAEVASCIITDISKSKNESFFKVCPNPTNGILKLPYPVSWQVSSTTGDILANGMSREIDLSDFENGIYILTTSRGDAIRLVKI